MPAFSGSREAHEWLANGPAGFLTNVTKYGLEAVPYLFCQLSARAETWQKLLTPAVNTYVALHHAHPIRAVGAHALRPGGEVRIRISEGLTQADLSF